MAEKSGFFNALLSDGEYDRKYNANDYSDNLAVIIGNGVLRSENDDLKVTASGMVVLVGIGRAWINGHFYKNDTVYSFVPTPVSTGGARWDRVMLRLDNQLAARKISLEYVQGTTASTPVKPEPTRTDSVYDLVLADIYVAANADSVVVTDTRADADVCGWVYSTSGDGSFFESLDSSFHDWFSEKKDELASVTLFKRYTHTQTLSVAASLVQFSIPQYDVDTCFLEVYVNGILDNRHSISGNVITFTGTLIAGTVVTVNCYKSIDGEGIMSVADEITELQNQMAQVIGSSKFVYTCTGLNDNIALSEIAQAFYAGSYTEGTLTDAAEAFLDAIGGNDYLAELDNDAQIGIDVVGSCGVQNAYSGSGTASSRYRWFELGTANKESKRIVFDFAKCDSMNFNCAASTDNIIFYGTDLNMKNANVNVGAAGASCAIAMFVGSSSVSSGRRVDNSRLTVAATGNASIANGGEFIGCDTLVKSSGGNACAFDCSNNSLIRVIGGNHKAYAGSSSNKATVLNTESGSTNAAIMALDINCPTESVSGYVQKHYANGAAGVINVNGAITTLTSNGASVTSSNVIAKNKL